jgi:hypothetical protein
MKTKLLVSAILLAACLTGWASSITPHKISEIRIGETTEADLVHLFGPPTTRFVDLSHTVALDWFRSVPMGIGGYLPFFGWDLGGHDLEAQQLSVVLSPGGRVMRYEMHSSKDKPRADAAAAIIEHSK